MKNQSSNKSDGHFVDTQDAPEPRSSTTLTTSSSDNLFNPERLRLSQDFAVDVGVKKALLTVPVRKPDKQWFFRVHPDTRYRLDTAVLEVKDLQRETYLVEPSFWSDLRGEIIPKTLFTGVNRQGVLFLLPVRLPGPDGRIDEWNRTLFESAMIAMEKWVRLVPNMSLGAYEVFEAMGNLPEPEFPAMAFQEILQIAFKDRFIASLDHPVPRKLRGES